MHNLCVIVMFYTEKMLSFFACLTFLFFYVYLIMDIYGYFLQSLIFINNFFSYFILKEFFYIRAFFSSPSKDFKSIIFLTTNCHGNYFHYFKRNLNLLFQPRIRQLVKEKKKKGEKEKEKIWNLINFFFQKNIEDFLFLQR